MKLDFVEVLSLAMCGLFGAYLAVHVIVAVWRLCP